MVGSNCTGDPLPVPGVAAEDVVEVPATPSIEQIRSAYRELPFCMPVTGVEPPGGRTLINLPTYFAASWPEGDCLKPGSVSETVTLLSWDIEFRVEAQDYRYVFGDGEDSGWVTSPGGRYPDGDITHTYTSTGDVEVKVDARLTGEYRVNGGAWQDLGATADLQDEPVQELTVVGTRTRLTS